MQQSVKIVLVAGAMTGLLMITALFASSAHAECDVYCFQRQAVGGSNARHRHSAHQVRRSIPRFVYDANGNQATEIVGGHPNGCPHSYCGCGLRMYLGLADNRLNLAWNWARLFPHTSARPGAAAVRRGHVMLLVSHVHGSVWIVRDYNSGNGLSRVHARSVAGYVFVNPT